MDIIIALIITFSIIIFSIYKSVFVGIPLIFTYLVFLSISLKRGFEFKELLNMSLAGGRKAFIVLKIFILIGAISSIWMASGTVPAIVYYCIKFMNPKYFIIYTFIICSLVSFLLGTAFGTVSTVGIALMVLAKGGGVNINIAAGAIMSGAYFGDRCSPMSSSANLVSNLTKTDLYTNISNMFKSSAITYILSAILYSLISIKEPLDFIGNSIDWEIIKVFDVNLIVLLPAFLILILALLKVNIKLSMCISILCSIAISVFIQNHSMIDICKYLLFGFKLHKSSSLYTIIQGGGIISMWKAATVVFISCSLAGIFSGTNMLIIIENKLATARTRESVFLYTALTSIFTGAFGCNQSISIVLTNQLMNKAYEKNKLSNYQMAIDLENTCIVLCPLIPWNIAALVPTTTIGVTSSSFIPFAFYLYLLPLITGTVHWLTRKKILE